MLLNDAYCHLFIWSKMCVISLTFWLDWFKCWSVNVDCRARSVDLQEGVNVN